MEIDFTDQIKELKATKECGCTDDCDCSGNCGGDCSCQEAQAEKNYPGKNVERREDGVPKKKQKKRACKKGEHRDKSGKLVKNSKGDEEKGYDLPQPKTKGLENPRNQHEYDNNRDVNIDGPIDLSPYMPQTKELENPRNMNEYYKNLYKKVKGLD